MSATVSHITGILIVCSTICSGEHHRNHQSSAPLSFVREIYRWAVESHHKGPVTRNMFPFAYVIIQMLYDKVHNYCGTMTDQPTNQPTSQPTDLTNQPDRVGVSSHIWLIKDDKFKSYSRSSSTAISRGNSWDFTDIDYILRLPITQNIFDGRFENYNSVTLCCCREKISVSNRFKQKFGVSVGRECRRLPTNFEKKSDNCKWYFTLGMVMV